MFPPKAVLAAVDFSDASRVALSCAARLAKQCQAQLHVLHVEDPLLAAAAKSTGVDLTSETREELGRFMQSAYPAGDWAPSHHVIAGSSVDVICHIAERESADVIVIGAHGMSGFEKAVFGSTTEGVLRNADTSVLVVPDHWAPPRPDLDDLTGTGPVIVGLELTPAAIEAARDAAALAALLGTSIEIHHIVPPMPVLSRWSRHAEAAVRTRVEAARAEIESALHYLVNVAPASVKVDTGPVAERLADAVKPGEGRHPLLVLGRRTAGERGGMPGSTAYRVLSRVDAPVLMCVPER